MIVTRDHHKFRTENELTIRGSVINAASDGLARRLIIHTEVAHEGKLYPKDFTVVIPREARHYSIAEQTSEGHIVEVKGSIHPDDVVFSDTFENLSLYARTSHLHEISSKNNMHLQGAVKKISDDENLLVLTITTQYKHKGSFKPKEFTVKVPHDAKAYSSARQACVGHLIRLQGPVHADNAIVARQFENYDRYYAPRGVFRSAVGASE